MVQDAVIRNFTIIGEASNHITASTKQRFPEINWQIMTGFRNFLVHEYYRVDLITIWDTVQYDLSSLEAQLEIVLADTFGREDDKTGV